MEIFSPFVILGAIVFVGFAAYMLKDVIFASSKEIPDRLKELPAKIEKTIDKNLDDK